MMKRAKIVVTVFISFLQFPANLAAQIVDLECRTLSRRLEIAKVSQKAIAQRYATCVKEIANPSNSTEFLGFTCEFELNQAVREQKRLSSAFADAFEKCQPKNTDTLPPNLGHKPAPLLPAVWTTVHSN
jgi:hypothetical protein